MDATDKYNQLPHSATGHSPHKIWFEEGSPYFANLYIFGQLGYVPVINKSGRHVKHKHRGKLVRLWGGTRPDTYMLRRRMGQSSDTKRRTFIHTSPLKIQRQYSAGSSCIGHLETRKPTSLGKPRKFSERSR